MRSAAAASIASLIAAAGLAAGAQAPRFRSTTQTVPVYVTALDSRGRLVPDLSREEFEILDNGVDEALSASDNAIQKHFH